MIVLLAPLVAIYLAILSVLVVAIGVAIGLFIFLSIYIFMQRDGWLSYLRKPLALAIALSVLYAIVRRYSDDEEGENYY